MKKVFISYNRRNEPVARTLADDIKALGHEVWFDQELSGGQTWWDKILSTVRDCDVFIFVLDKEALDSVACKREYGYAADLGKPILPVMVSADVPTSLLPPALSQIQFIEYHKKDHDAAIRLARALNTIPPPNPLPDPLPSPPEVPISYLGSLSERIETTSTLSYEEQSGLVIELKRALHDTCSADDTRKLLERLRRRRDLFAAIADEIDEMLRSQVQKPPSSESTSRVDIFKPESTDSGTGLRDKETEALRKAEEARKKEEADAMRHEEEQQKKEALNRAWSGGGVTAENEKRFKTKPFIIVVIILLAVSLIYFFSSSSRHYVEAPAPETTPAPAPATTSNSLSATDLYAEGLKYFNGDGVPQNYEVAANYFRKAAEQGHAPAQNVLGYMYGTGTGVTLNYEEAVYWYRKAAEQGFAWGQFNLGVMYAHGYGVPQNFEEAIQWYRKAAEQGNENARKVLTSLGKW